MGQRRGEVANEATSGWGTTPCSTCPLRASKHYRKFSPGELKFIETFKIDELRRDTGQTILTEGEGASHLYTVLSGWVMKYKSLEDGRRQIINYAFPGDLVGLQGTAFGKMQHSVEALSPVTLCVFDKKKVWSLYEALPGSASTSRGSPRMRSRFWRAFSSRSASALRAAPSRSCSSICTGVRRSVEW